MPPGPPPWAQGMRGQFGPQAGPGAPPQGPPGPRGPEAQRPWQGRGPQGRPWVPPGPTPGTDAGAWDDIGAGVPAKPKPPLP